MLKSLRFSSLCLFAASAGVLACTPGGTTSTVIDSGTPTGSGGALGTGGAIGSSGGATGSSGGAIGSGGETGSGSGGSTSGSGGAVATGSGGAGETGGSVGTASGGSTGSGGRGGMIGATGGSTGSGGAAGATGAGGAAENKIVLYDGTAASFSGWFPVRNPNNANPWANNADATMTVRTGTGDIQSKMKFQDLFVHVEYMTPVVQASDTGATGQNRGNSGIYLKGSYEMQVLDSYGMAPAIDSCGAVYSIKAPSETACLMGGQWNTYEIEFKANVCDASGKKMANAKIVKATLNGKMVQQNVDVPNVTTAGQAESCSAAGLLLQDHSSFKPVIFRNIWVIPRN